MTTVAYKDGQLCADSASTRGGTLLGSVRKIARAPDGSLVASAGCTISCASLAAWAEAGMSPGERPDIKNDDFTALIVRLDGTVRLLGADGTEAQIDAPFHAIGSGWQIALGAMAQGATAEQAVEIACRYDGGSRGPVQVEHI